MTNGAKGSLTNEDLEAVPPEKRTWTTWSYVSLWIGMAICIPSYQLASGLLSLGMSWFEALGTIALANLIVVVPMVLNGHAGAKFGIPFPVYARASFGVYGANLPAILRALVACGWFGINTWIGGAALAVVLQNIFGLKISESSFLVADASSVLHVRTGDFLCFLGFWLVNMGVVVAGIEGIRKLLFVKSIFLPLATLGLLFWAWQVSKGDLSALFKEPSRIPREDFLKVFAPALTGMVGFWSTLSLNIPDFTRFAKSQRAQVVGQAVALPSSMTFITLVSIAVTSATVFVPAFHGEKQWDPVKIVQTFESSLLVATAMLCVAVSTLATNIAANIVSPANDFANVWPEKISFRTGGIITGVVGILMCPWKLLENPAKYINGWLVGYSGLLGPIAGILIVDYFVVRKTELDAKGLYEPNGPYRYRSGWNPVALVAFVVGVLPCVPGFAVKAQIVAPGAEGSLLETLTRAYDYAWFVGFALASVIYAVGMKLQGPPPAIQSQPVPERATA